VKRICTHKLLTLVICFLLTAFAATGQQWVGVSSASASPYTINTSGNTSNNFQVTIDIPGFTFQDIQYEGAVCQFPLLQDGHPLLVKGGPELQKLTFTLNLPASGNLDVNVEASDYIDYVNINILPSAGNIVKDGTNNILVEGESYSIDSFFPGKLIDSENPFITRNSRSQAFQVYPFQYNPVTRVLRFYYHFSFSMKNTGGAGINPLSDSDSRIKSIAELGTETLNQESHTLKTGQIPAERGCLLIICPQNFKAAIEPLAAWKIQTGVLTEIIDAEQFTNADGIFNYVKEYYYSKGNLAYLLLVGDAKQVPSLMLPTGASDNSYSYLSGNDHYPDILVGRFSAESVKDVEVQVHRTIQYEKNPGIDATWIAKATGIGSTLSPGDDGESDFQHIRNLLNILKNTTYNTYSEFFDGSQGEADAAGNPSASDITAKVNQGTGLIMYAGHGSPNIMATGSITRSVIESLDNNGKYPLIWSAACENGNFTEKYCIAEAWLRASDKNGDPTGAIAAVMASGAQTSYPPMHAQDKIAEMMSLPQEGLSTMGAISVKGMMYMNDVYGSAGFDVTDTWILFGDPSLKVRTSTPKQLVAEHKGTIGLGKNIYSVKCNLEEGFACISNKGSILGIADVIDGQATIILDQPVSVDELTLTITAINYIPYISTLKVQKEPGQITENSPLNHSRLQTINKTFSWENGDGGNPEYYLFSLGTDNPPSNLINAQKVTSTELKAQFNLKYNTTYYWQVIPVNSYGSTESKVLDFSTIFSPDEDFELSDKSQLSWSNGGMQKWENDGNEYFDGLQSIRSGQIKDNEYTSLAFPCEVTNCDFVSFWSKTSSDEGDKLQFFIDGSAIEEWSGITGWNFHIYKVEPGLHELEWRYTKDSDISAGVDAVWLDNIHLPIHDPVFVSVSETGTVCEGSGFETAAIASNYFNIIWQSEGDGGFTDNNLENAVYKAGFLDIQNQKTVLNMQLESFDGCPVLNKKINLIINPLPVIPLPSDTIITEGYTVRLDAGLDAAMTYNWQPDGSSSPVIEIDSMSSVNGAKTTNITITSQYGCSATKEILIHFNNTSTADIYTVFPNPSNGNFTVKPEKGSSVIDKMTLYDKEGKAVWESLDKKSIVGTEQVSIPGLASGIYYLLTSNIHGQSVNPIVIQ